MAENIVVYNLQDNNTPVESSSSDIASPTLSQGTPTAETSLPSGQSALAITEGDVRVILRQEMEHWTGDIRVGALLSGQVFILDSRGMMMGGTEFSTAPFSVNYNGALVASSATISGSITATSGAIGGWTIGATTITGGSVTLDSAGNIRFGKTSFADTTNAGLIMGLNGATPTFYIGTASDASYMKLSGGVYDMVGTVSSRSTLTIASAIDSSGNLITDIANARLNSSARTMLAGFTFGATDYSGALSSGTITWNTTTGALTGGSGVLVYRGGIIGAVAGVATFTIDAATGAATFSGTLSAPTGAIGGFTIGATTLSATSGGDTTSLSSGATAFSAGPTATPSVTITQAGVLTATGVVIAGTLNPTTTAVAGENITAGDAVTIRINEIVKAVATHDAKVLESSAGTNYGTDTTATVGSNNATNNGDSYCFIKFDLTTIAVTVADKVYLRLQLTNSTSSAGDDFELNAYQVTGADWDESTITWTNKPAINASIDGSWEFSESSEFTDDYLEESSAISYAFIDITTLYNAWKGGTNNYGVAVRFVERGTGAESTAAIRTVDLGTSENATVALRPTLIVSGVSDNIGKVYKANATNFTDLLGPTGISLTTTVAAATDTIQRSGIVTNQSSLTPGKTYFITDSETISTTAGTVVRPIGTALSSANLSIIDDTSKIVIDNIFWSASSGPEDHNITNTIFLPIGFSPKLIRFDGTFLTSGSTYLPADGIWYNGTQLTTTNDVVTNGYLIYYVSGNRTVTLTVTSVHDSGVLLTVQLKDTSGASSEAAGIKGILTFQA